MIHNYCVCPKFFVILQRVSVYFSVIMCKKVEEHIPIENLQHYEDLRLLQELIEERYRYSFESIEVYRTVRSNPPTDVDLIPTAYLNVNDLPSIEPELTRDLVDVLEKERKINYIGSRSLSVNKTADKCIREARKAIDKFAAIHTQEETEAKIQERGEYVAKFTITPKHGRITKFHNGVHAQLLLYKDVHIGDVWDSSTPVIPFKYNEDGTSE